MVRFEYSIDGDFIYAVEPSNVPFYINFLVGQVKYTSSKVKYLLLFNLVKCTCHMQLSCINYLLTCIHVFVT